MFLILKMFACFALKKERLIALPYKTLAFLSRFRQNDRIDDPIISPHFYLNWRNTGDETKNMFTGSIIGDPGDLFTHAPF